MEVKIELWQDPFDTMTILHDRECSEQELRNVLFNAMQHIQRLERAGAALQMRFETLENAYVRSNG